ncbi:hypothetical protein ACUY4R_002241 [Kosakonia sp. BK9b]
MIMFPGECLHRRKILPVGGKKKMRPVPLIFSAHPRAPVSRDAFSMSYTGKFKVFREAFRMLKRNATVPCTDNHAFFLCWS